MATVQISVKLPEQTLKRLDKLGEETKSSRNGLIVEIIESHLATHRVSAHDALSHLCGIVKNAPPDGSTSDAWRERLER